MQAVTALGYYSVVTVVLLVTAYLFFHRDLRLYAFFLVISTFGDMILTTALRSSIISPVLTFSTLQGIPSRPRTRSRAATRPWPWASGDSLACS
jgi:hypothetical protein